MPYVTLSLLDGVASEAGANPGKIQVKRSGSTASSLTVYYSLSGTAVNGSDYVKLSGTLVIPKGASSKSLKVIPIDDSLKESGETVTVDLEASSAYQLGSSGRTVTVADND